MWSTNQLQRVYAVCLSCGNRTIDYQRIEEAIAAWNRRAANDINVAPNADRIRSMRLIDEIAYQEKIAKIPVEERTFVKAWETAQEMPEIDAVPVVRCENCKHYNRVGCSDGFGWCERMDIGVNDDFYCSLAEMKEQEAHT